MATSVVQAAPILINHSAAWHERENYGNNIPDSTDEDAALMPGGVNLYSNGRQDPGFHLSTSSSSLNHEDEDQSPSLGAHGSMKAQKDHGGSITARSLDAAVDAVLSSRNLAKPFLFGLSKTQVVTNDILSAEEVPSSSSAHLPNLITGESVREARLPSRLASDSPSTSFYTTIALPTTTTPLFGMPVPVPAFSSLAPAVPKNDQGNVLALLGDSEPLFRDPEPHWRQKYF